jgi:D-beta-D-heptose 7-phosphate kinase/D-beta-D-heptose 1-phosphate adenosyltransferase
MRKKIFTNGCFDILHRGHFELLQYCKSLGGDVIVGLNSDDSAKRLKGVSRPVVKQQDRKFMLESCKYVDEVIIFSEDTPYELMKQVGPDIIVKGGDYKKENIIGRDLAIIEIFNYIEGYSTTKILEAR